MVYCQMHVKPMIKDILLQRAVEINISYLYTSCCNRELNFILKIYLERQRD